MCILNFCYALEGIQVLNYVALTICTDAEKKCWNSVLFLKYKLFLEKACVKSFFELFLIDANLTYSGAYLMGNHKLLHKISQNMCFFFLKKV